MPSMSRECLGASLPTLMLAATSIRFNLRSCGFGGNIDDFLLFCCGAAEGLKARFDTTHQNFEVFQRGFALARRPTLLFEDNEKSVLGLIITLI